MPECAQINGSGYVSAPIHAKMAKVWICQNMFLKSCEYISGSAYARILDIARFWICRTYTGFLICHNMTEYVWIEYEYAWLCLKINNKQGSGYAKVLNISHTIHSGSQVTNKLKSTYWEMDVFRTLSEI